MAKRFRACRWYRGGHDWGQWYLVPYRVTWFGVSRNVMFNERECGKCLLGQLKDVA